MRPLSLSDQRWWLETWRHLDRDSDRSRALRSAGDGLCNSPFWSLLHAELLPLGANFASRSELHGRLALACLLQMVLDYAPRELRGLVQLLSRRDQIADFQTVGLLVAPMFRVLDAFAQVLAPGTIDPMHALAQHGGAIAWDPATAGTDAAARREQARYILAYRDASAGLHESRIGVLSAARWAADSGMRPRLERVGGRLDPRALSFDLLGVVALAALRFRTQAVRLGHVLPLPDARAYLASVGELERAMAGSEQAATPPTPSRVPAAPTVVTSVVVASHATAPPPPGPEPGMAEWLVAVRHWAAGRAGMLDAVFAMAPRFESCRLWPQLSKDVARMSGHDNMRAQQASRLALATLLDECHRSLDHRDLAEVLERVAVETDEVVRTSDVGELWALFEPMFVGWARQLDPDVAAEDKGHVMRTLGRRGDILPLDEVAKGSFEKRRRTQDAAVDAVYTRGERDPTIVRRGIFWAATRARNDRVHRNPDSLAGLLRPMELLADVTALAAQATMRFRIRVAEDARTPTTVPSLAGLSALLMKVLRGSAP